MGMISTIVNFINMQKEKINLQAILSKFKKREGNLSAITFLCIQRFMKHLRTRIDIIKNLILNPCLDTLENFKTQ